VTGVLVGLLLHSAVVLVAAPRLLPALTASGHVPRVGIAAWLTAIGTVLACWLAAAVLIVVEVMRRWTHPRAVAVSCLAFMRHTIGGDSGIVPQTVSGVIVAAMTLATGITGVRLARAVWGMRARAHDHAQAVRLVGWRTGQADVVMVENAKPAAYCVAGRPPAIVVTSTARAALDDRQLAAVLAHERAHLNGHHARIVTVLHGLAAVFPGLTLMTEGAQEVSRLLEMRADDVALRGHSRQALLSGLITLCASTSNEALAAAGLAVLARAERLASPPRSSVKVKTGAALGAVIAIMAAAPVIGVAGRIGRSHAQEPSMVAVPQANSTAQFAGYMRTKALVDNRSGKEISNMMMWDNNGHWGGGPWGWGNPGWGSWIFTTGITVVFWALVITAVVLAARYLLSLSQRAPGTTCAAGTSKAEQVLAERYARGDIDDDEYRRRLNLLRENMTRTTTT
jgi:uncharacterized membrane protein/Zn-dependent protease with chaperone function